MRSPASYPRLHRSETKPPARPSSLPGWEELASAFQSATGWQLAWESTPATRSRKTKKAKPPAPRAKLSIKAVRGSAGTRRQPAPTVSRERAAALARAFERTLRELDDARLALWQQDAELATAIPVRVESDAARQLATRLEAALQAAAEAIGCQAAAAYLLDEGTSELKLRAGWGLPPARLAAPARPLRGAMADLEALAGHAVTIENTATMPQWRVPEAFPAACCVPLASPTQLLGTVWVFGRKHRDFTREQTNVVELAAQRIAADLEREVLLREGASSRKNRDTIIVPVPSDPLPLTPHLSSPAPAQALRVRPVLDGWDFSAHSPASPAECLHWCDWAELPGGVLAVSVAEITGPRPELARSTVTAALAAHRSYPHDPMTLLEKLNETLCTTWSGSERAAVVYGCVGLAEGRVELAAAGSGGAILLGTGKRELIQLPSTELGLDPDATFAPILRTIAPGETLLIVGQQALTNLKRPGGSPTEDLVAAALAKLGGASPERMASAISELIAPAGNRRERGPFVLLRRRQ